MVLSYDEETNLQNLKQEHKLKLLEKQHSFTMKELEMQLRIEGVKVFQNTENIDKEQKEMRTKVLSFAFDEQGREK